MPEFDDAVAYAFKDLDKFLPGSKKVKKSVANPAPPKTIDENAWDANPVIKLLNGIETEFYPLGALANALQKKPVTVRLWERKGYIPQAPYRLKDKVLNGKNVKGPRVYTRAMIEAVIEEFDKRNLLGVERIEWSQYNDLTIAIYSRWQEIASQERN